MHIQTLLTETSMKALFLFIDVRLHVYFRPVINHLEKKKKNYIRLLTIPRRTTVLYNITVAVKNLCMG